MIRIVKKGDKLTEADVLGKYVLQEQPYHWLAFGRPRIATKVSGNRVYIDRERPVQKDGLFVLTGDGEREPDGYTTLPAVKCVCDTPEEANAVLDADKETAREFEQLRNRAVERFKALDGMSLDAAAPAPR